MSYFKPLFLKKTMVPETTALSTELQVHNYYLQTFVFTYFYRLSPYFHYHNYSFLPIPFYPF